MRIRTVKPDFHTSKTISQVSTEAAYIGVALLAICDDEGYFEASPEYIKGLLFPWRKRINIAAGLAELQGVNFIKIRQGEDGYDYGFMPNFSENQIIKKERFKPSKIKGLCQWTDVATDKGPTRDGHATTGVDREWNGMEGEWKGKEKVKKESFLFRSEKFGESFHEHWSDWVDYRRTLKKPKSWKPFFERQFKKLHDFSEENAIRILSNSTLNGYTGLVWDRYPTGDQPARQATKAEQPKTVWQIKQQIEATEEQMKEIKETHFFNHRWTDIEKQKQWKTLKDHFEILKFQATGVSV
jgi:hypothetical protein